MATELKINISVEAVIYAGVEKVWNFYTKPEHIIKWNTASDEWHTTKAENDLQKGGRFLSRMEAKDGSFGFDFGGVYDEIKLYELVAYTLDDGRKATITFKGEGESTIVVVAFEAETQNPIEMQKSGWQAIINSFKKYTETNS